MSERSFSDDVKINKYKLEEECEKHAGLYFYWAEKLAEAKNKLNHAEDALKLTSAEEELRIRNNWDDSNGKQTEAGIKAVLETKIQKAKVNIQTAQDDVNILYAAVSAMDHRKSELDNLVTLLVKGFYAAPNGGKREGPVQSTERDIRKKLNKE